MSEAFEKVSGVKRLPLFPLPLVLLPNEVLPLHVFEPRYRQMLEDIARGNNLFGVSFFNPNESFVERPAAETVGCAAEVREAQRLPDGTSNVLTVGLIRYRLLDYIDEGEPYAVGDVEFFEDFAEDASVVQPLADEVFELFRRIAEAAHRLSGTSGALPEIARGDAEALSFQTIAAFNLAPDLKYQMIQTRSTLERLEKMREIMRRTVGRMEENADIQTIAKTNGHAKKKIEI